MNGLTGRRFLVCGAASGIGEATALRLAAEGAVVILADRNADSLTSVVQQIPGATAMTYDQGDAASIAALFAKVTAAGALNGVAVVAGVHPGLIPIADVTVDSFRDVHAINSLGVLLVLQQAVAAVARDARSSIAVVSSVAGLRPVARDAVYASSKAAVQAIVRAVALEVAGEGIRVNSVLPGTAITPLVLSESSIDEVWEGAAASIPLRRPATAAEVASTICFLLSDDASHVTAVELLVDGGLAAGRPS